MDQMYSSNLIEVSNKFPDLAVSIRLKDLIAANRCLIQEAKEDLAKELSESRQEKFISVEKVIELLSVSKPTLWRWQKSEYLVPVSVGGRNRYRMSDINRILESRET